MVSKDVEGVVLEGELVDKFELKSSFGQSIKAELIRQEKRIKMMLVRSPSFLKVLKASVPKTDYRLVLNELQKKELESGMFNLLKKKDGTYQATIVNAATKKFKANLSLEKISLTPELSEALIDHSNQLQLAHVADELYTIQVLVEEVRQGMIDDRFARAYSCEQKYLQSLKIKNPRLREIALLNVISDAEDSRNFLMKQQEQSIKFIRQQPDSFFKQLLEKTKLRDIDNRMSEIRESFNAINIVSMIQAAAYKELGEPEAMLESIGYYHNHLSNQYFADDSLLDHLDLIDNSPDNYWSCSLPKVKNLIEPMFEIRSKIESGDVSE